MPVVSEKKVLTNFNAVLSAAKKLTPGERQLLKLKLFGDEALSELKAFEMAMKKRKPVAKKTDAEILEAVKKMRLRNAVK